MGRPATITTFNGPVANLKITEIDPETFALVVTGLATPSGNLYNPETAEKPKSTGRVYSKLFVVSFSNAHLLLISVRIVSVGDL